MTAGGLGDRTDLSDDDEQIAQLLGEKHCPARTEHRRKYGVIPEGVDRWDWYEDVVTPSPGADAATMTTFRAGDDGLSLRPLTWREVVAEIAPLIRSREAERIANEIEAANNGRGFAGMNRWAAVNHCARIARGVAGKEQDG